MKTKHKERKNIIQLLLTVLFAFIIIAGSIPVSASVLESNGVDRNHACSITMTVNVDEWYVDGSAFRLYKVADLTDDLGFSYTDAFKGCTVNVGLTPNSVAMNTASDLIQYVRDNNIQENASVQIRNRTFTFSNLSLGLYLIQGDTAKEGNRTVTYQPVVICVPQRDSATEEWSYNITSHVKSADPTYVTTQTPATETPAKPKITPKTSSGTTTASKKTTSRKKVKTGDTSRTRFYLTVLFIDAAAIALIVILRRRSRKNAG